MKLGYGDRFVMGSASAFGGPFNNVPDRVGSAPATDIGTVINY